MLLAAFSSQLMHRGGLPWYIRECSLACEITRGYYELLPPNYVRFDVAVETAKAGDFF